MKNEYIINVIINKLFYTQMGSTYFVAFRDQMDIKAIKSLQDYANPVQLARKYPRLEIRFALLITIVMIDIVEHHSFACVDVPGHRPTI